MTGSQDDKKFNDTLKRLMDQKPKPHEDMKKGRKPQKEDRDERNSPQGS
ncbi:hypothetical protein [Henriciella sp.]|nr:hypothetical protein [Henriciella sp.]